MKVFSNEKGMTIILVLALGAMAAVIFMVLSKKISISQESTKTKSSKSEFLTFLESMREQLEDPVICQGALLDEPFDGALPEKQFRNIRVKLSYGSTAGPIQAGWTNGGRGFQLERVVYRRIDMPARTVRYDRLGQSFNLYRAEIAFLPKLVDQGAKVGRGLVGRGYNDPTRDDSRRIEIFVKVAGGLIKGCHGLRSAATVCESNGGGYDVTAPPTFRCNPDKVCWSQNNGIVTSTASCVNPFDARRVGYFSGSERYVCQWCWDGVKNW